MFRDPPQLPTIFLKRKWAVPPEPPLYPVENRLILQSTYLRLSADMHIAQRGYIGVFEKQVS